MPARLADSAMLVGTARRRRSRHAPRPGNDAYWELMLRYNDECPECMLGRSLIYAMFVIGGATLLLLL